MNVLKTALILVVDDSKFNLTVIKKTLQQINLEIVTATDGEEALEKISIMKFDLIITDTVMPKMDGISLIKEIKQLKTNDFIPIILMTGSDDQNVKITSLNIGADDFLSKPIDQKELVARVFSLLRLKRTHDLLYEKNRLIERELEAARRVQQHIIPNNFSNIDYPNVSGFYLPMEDIGGDFFDYYKLHNNKIGFLIADVTGHGIPAALIVTMTKMIFSNSANKFNSTKKLFTVVNKEICSLLMDSQYVTSFYCIYDPESKKLRFSNAGHCLPLLYKHKNKKVYSLETDSGFFLGILDSTEYDQKSVKIDTGDRLLLYTDGVTEIKDKDNKQFSEKGLKSFMINNSQMRGNDFCNKLFDTIMDFSYKKIRNDDIAFLNIEF
jgi:sigma-B regulation protein RsbU (phosphoserine phosphatase)